MASPKRKAPEREPLAFEPQEKGDFEALLEHIRENPLQYAAGAIFLVVCMLAGIFYRVSAEARQRERVTELMRALDTTDPALQTAEFEPLAQANDEVAPQALYLMAEAAYRARDYDKARAAFEQLRTRYPDFQSTPDAVEGLGYIAEEKGDAEETLARYREVLEKWPDTFAGKRQPLNIARCEERLGRLEQAVASYQLQVQIFPGSSVAREADAALARLREGHPDLFPALSTAVPEPEAAPPLLDTAGGETEPVAPLPEEAPAPEAAP